ncbi:hypothetical protein TGAM01_v210521 [Trichoderma gamsii]|uniref:HAT C-terminal dimerisation domain-containing protein n=1 Tax=Trichoderma gamsii TaxID=398673 RepID=A0A2P4Z8M3_9HYPO|nr:hypothetical protein TGAM01_v210521 [Trichoderma gamsii]PON20647.1 hypothetical protein TGAM01_v210521 [Trichoderma gamsii]
MLSIIEERWISQGGKEQDRPAILKEKLSLEEWKVVAAVQKILQLFKVASKQLQGAGISGKRSTSGGFDEHMAHEPACNAISEPGSHDTLDHVERRLAFSRSIVRQDAEGLQSKRPKQPTALSTQDELEQYLSEPPVDNIAYKADPIAWWRDVGAVRFPQLSYMAIDFLTIASSSAETERDFSSCGSWHGTVPSIVE